MKLLLIMLVLIETTGFCRPEQARFNEAVRKSACTQAQERAAEICEQARRVDGHQVKTIPSPSEKRKPSLPNPLIERCRQATVARNIACTWI
jgi:hypothetical protein